MSQDGLREHAALPVQVYRCEEGRCNAERAVLQNRGAQLDGQHRRTLILVRQRHLHSTDYLSLCRVEGAT